MSENKVVAWIKTHKTELIIAGGITVATVGAILLYNNWNMVKTLLAGDDKLTSSSENSLGNVILSPNINAAPIIQEPEYRTIIVPQHLRTLPQGHHPSAWKLAEAAEEGIELSANQTFVSSYQRSYAA